MTYLMVICGTLLYILDGHTEMAETFMVLGVVGRMITWAVSHMVED